MRCGARLCEERSSDGVTVLRRVARGGEAHGTDARFVVADHLGSTREVTDDSSVIVSRLDYAPFGERLVVSGEPEAVLKGYTGFDVSVDAAIPMARYRAYLPAAGRWTSDDPAGFVDGAHLVRYALNNPVTNVDPSGLYTIDKSCRNRNQCFDDGNQNLEDVIKRQTDASCANLGFIADPRLRRCVETSCKKGTIKCKDNCRPNMGGYNIKIPFFTSRTANLCVNNWPPYTPTQYVGNTVIHEWAHGCGWDHEDGGGIQ